MHLKKVYHDPHLNWSIKNVINYYVPNKLLVKVLYQPTPLTAKPPHYNQKKKNCRTWHQSGNFSALISVTRLSRLLVISHLPTTISASVCLFSLSISLPGLSSANPKRLYVLVWWFWELLCSTSIQAGQVKCLKMTEIPPKLIVQG